MDVVFRILNYLKDSLGNGLLFTKNGHLNIEGYTDADLAVNVVNRKSTSGGTSLSWEGIWSHGELRNKMWLHYLVMRHSTEVYLKACVSFSTFGSY